MLEKLRFLSAMVATPRVFAATLALMGSSGCLVVAPCAGGGQCGENPDPTADGGDTSGTGPGETSEGSSVSTQVTGSDDSATDTGSTNSVSTNSVSTDSAASDMDATSEDGDPDVDGGTGEISTVTGNGDSSTSSDVESDTLPTAAPTSDEIDDSNTGDTATNGETNDTVSESSSETSGSTAIVASSSPEGDTSAPSVTTSDVDSTSDVAGTSSEPATTTTDEDTEPQGVPVHEVKWQEGFEDGLAGWTTEGATWTADAPSGAAPAPQSGGRLVGTGLNGPYVRENSRLLSPKFIVPPRYREPYLRYWYWYQLEPGDTVQVQVRVGDSPTWVDFQTVTDTLSTVAGESGKWLQGILPLSDFGGQEIQLSFALTATGESCSVPGFFVDNVSLETGPMNICSCQGFNNGSHGDWSVEGGQWAIGAPANAGAPAPQTGNGAAGTNLFGNYASLAAAPAARLASPTVKVADDGNTKAKFSYWYSFSSAGRGKIQLRVVGEQWQDLPEYTFTGQHETWTYLEIPLNAWAGQIIQVGFLMENGGGVETPTTRGFYIDEFNF